MFYGISVLNHINIEILQEFFLIFEHFVILENADNVATGTSGKILSCSSQIGKFNLLIALVNIKNKPKTNQPSYKRYKT